MSIAPRHRKHRRAPTGLAKFQRARRRRRYSPWRLLFVATIALLVALVILGRMLRPLHRPPYSHTRYLSLLSGESLLELAEGSRSRSQRG